VLIDILIEQMVVVSNKYEEAFLISGLYTIYLSIFQGLEILNPIYTSIAKGMLKLKVAPLPSLLFSAHILSPCASTIFLQINNPKPIPVPLSDFIANFVNNLGNISESIPEPVSLMLTVIALLLLLLMLFPLLALLLPSLFFKRF
jgi:hypothetical protein